jgi:capsular exopolysaccharide synthesis family protein
MGRVQDALRRAAEQAARDSAQKTEPAAEPAAAAEAFPEEPAAEPAAAEHIAAEHVATAEPSSTEPAGDLPLSAPSFDPDAIRPAEAAVDHVNGTSHEPGLHFSQKLAAKLVVDQTMVASSREQYRRLAAALHHAHEATNLSVVMIASAVAGEGKSLTAANLALTFSESYHRSVLLIDGDLRRPSLHRLFAFDAPTGLSEALSAIDEPEISLHQVSERLTIMPGGRANSDPMAGLTSVRMRRLIEEARETFDWVFIDTPPVGLLSDANLLAAMVDAAVLVIRADRTPHTLVQRAIDAVGRDRIIGAVLNQATASTRASYYEYYHYYQTRRVESAPGR